MYLVYILFSATKESYYVGFTGDVITERIRRHNSNHRGFTGGVGDWKLVYSEPFEHKATAARREREIKRWKNKKMIQKLVQRTPT